jgi:hypothetical protein
MQQINCDNIHLFLVHKGDMNICSPEKSYISRGQIGTSHLGMIDIQATTKSKYYDHIVLLYLESRRCRHLSIIFICVLFRHCVETRSALLPLTCSSGIFEHLWLKQQNDEFIFICSPARTTIIQWVNNNVQNWLTNHWRRTVRFQFLQRLPNENVFSWHTNKIEPRCRWIKTGYSFLFHFVQNVCDFYFRNQLNE